MLTEPGYGWAESWLVHALYNGRLDLIGRESQAELVDGMCAGHCTPKAVALGPLLFFYRHA